MRGMPVYDQGSIGSCTANALCAAFGYDTADHFRGSRLFLYYNERRMEGTVAQDCGAVIANGVRSLQQNGICPESEWPYNPRMFNVCPPERCYRDARFNRAVEVVGLVETLASLRACLALDRPFVVGIVIYASFESDEVARTGIVPLPVVSREACLGGHAILIVGYDDHRRVFIARNSWGEDWGDHGHFYLPYEYLLDPELSCDIWCIRSVRHLMHDHLCEKKTVD